MGPAGIALILVHPLCSHHRVLFIKLPDLVLQLQKVKLQNQYVSLRILFIIHPDQPMEHLQRQSFRKPGESAVVVVVVNVNSSHWLKLDVI